MMLLFPESRQVPLLKAAGFVLLFAILISGCGKPAETSGAKSGETNGVSGVKTNIASGVISTNLLAETNSIFDDKLKTGRDPFFPESIRRGEMVQKPKPVPNANGNASVSNAIVHPIIQAPVPVESYLILSGIIKQGQARLALLNGRTLAVNDSVSLELSNGKKIRVHCLEIGARSVTVTLDDRSEPKKIFLKK